MKLITLILQQIAESGEGRGGADGSSVPGRASPDSSQPNSQEYWGQGGLLSSASPPHILMPSLLFLVATTKHWRFQDPLSHFIKGKKHMRNISSFSSWMQ